MYTRRKPVVRVVTIHGYRVILHVTDVKMITVKSAVRSGFMHESKSTTGIHHLLEHVLTEGSKKCGKSCSNYWNSRGVNMNASTDVDRMMYYTNGLDDDLEHMVEYIVSITDHPIMRAKTVVKEKQAVIDELLTVGTDPETEIYAAVNHFIYKNGAEFQDDWKLQIKNLKQIEVDDLKRLYLEEFNPSSVAFIVSGQFQMSHVVKLFKKHLHPIPRGTLLPNVCFTFSPAIKYIKSNSPTSTIVIVFPSDVMVHEAMIVPQVAIILADLLFEELRTKRALIYNLHIDSTTNSCGTLVKTNVHVRDENVAPTLKTYLEVLRHYQSHPIPASALLAMKKKHVQTQSVNVPYANFYVDQLMSQMSEVNPKLYSPEEKLQAVRSATTSDIQRLLRRIIQFESMVIVAQGRTNRLQSISI